MTEVNSVEQLRELRRRIWFRWLFDRPPSYRFAIPDLPDSKNREATQLMSNYRNACGCTTGGVFMGVSVIGFIVHFFASGRGILDFGLMDLGAFIALFVGSMLIGKLVGVLWARVRMVQVVREMISLTNE